MRGLGKNRYPFSQEKKPNGVAAESALASALIEAENKSQAVEHVQAKVESGVEAQNLVTHEPAVAEIGTGNLDPENVFSYAVAGNFLKLIADGNRHILTVVDLLTKDKANWDKASYKADRDILISRMTDKDYCLDSLLRAIPLDRLSQLHTRLPVILEEQREAQYKAKLAQVTKKVDKHINALGEMITDKSILEATRKKLIDEALASMGLLDKPEVKPVEQPEASKPEAAKPVEPDTLKQPAKPSSEPRMADEAPTTKRTYKPRNPKKGRRGVGGKFPMYARLRAEANNPGVKTVNYVIKLFGQIIYANEWTRQAPAIKYVADVMGMEANSFKRGPDDAPFYDVRAQSNYLGRVGLNKMVQQEIERAGS